MKLNEDWAPLSGAWQNFKIVIQTAGLVDFYRHSALKHNITTHLDLSGDNDYFYLDIRSRSLSSD